MKWVFLLFTLAVLMLIVVRFWPEISKKLRASTLTPPSGTPGTPAPATPSPAPKASKGQFLDVLGTIFWGLIILGVVVVIVGGAESCMKEYRLMQAQGVQHQRLNVSLFSSVPSAYNAGNKYFRLGQYDQALQCYSRALEINPKHWKSWYNRAYTHSKMGIYQEAVRDYHEALKIEPCHPDSWYNLGVNCKNKGSIEEAIKAFGNFIKYASSNDPRITPTQREIENLGNSQPILEISEREKAEKMLIPDLEQF